jgi:hypothetical protein
MSNFRAKEIGQINLLKTKFKKTLQVFPPKYLPGKANYDNILQELLKYTEV